MDKIDTQHLKETILQAIWVQWGALGTQVESGRSAYSIVDPEALLLISLSLQHRERRLRDILAAWAQHGSGLLSLQRVKNLQEGFPSLAAERLAEFAHQASLGGKDFRWRSLAGPTPGPPARTEGLWTEYPQNWRSSALLLRLRSGFGVGVAADLLCFLLSAGGQWVSARQIAQAIGYSVHAIRRVADDLAAAQFIQNTSAKPVQYRVNPETWRPLLGYPSEIPAWRFWHQIYSFAANLIVRTENQEWDTLSPYLLSTTLRDLVEEHQDAFLLNQLDFPDPRKYPGEAYLPAFSNALERLVTWINEVV